MWDTPTGARASPVLHPLWWCFTGFVAVERSRGQGWGTASCHNGHPLWLRPFLPISVSRNKSRIKKTDGHGHTWVWSYSFTPCVIFWCCFFFRFCLFSSVPNSNVDPEIALSSSGSRWWVFVVWVSVCLLGFVSMNVLLLLQKSPIFDQLYLHSRLSSFVQPHSFLSWAINVVEQTLI